MLEGLQVYQVLEMREMTEMHEGSARKWGGHCRLNMDAVGVLCVNTTICVPSLMLPVVPNQLCNIPIRKPTKIGRHISWSSWAYGSKVVVIAEASMSWTERCSIPSAARFADSASQIPVSRSQSS
jgi:hypothetical protein